ncbi:hypothetical protein PG994_002673 [Apiospora phragmitis]|uniref:Tyrosinase copper-binding domain-containing protein n=1 Tax=Apiospora phragmitis TaxID=2905665 RepID=A0ABR1W5V4_9PEZI
MNFSQVAGFAVLANGAIGTTTLQSRDDDASSAEHEVKQLVAAIERKAFADLGTHDKSSGCTAETIVYRQEYGDLLKDERLDYIKAVQCLMSLPANIPSDYAPGAKSRITNSPITGTGPSTPRPQASPLFNDDPHSLGGNGAWDPALPASVVTLPEGVTRDPFTLPRGLGGGFVTTGPFANLTISLGPIAELAGGSPPNPRADGLGYNPRRLRRDVGPAVNERYANYTTVWDLLRKPNNTEYRLLSEGGFNNGEIGPHGGGHYTINGDPGGDLWVSPAEPAFWVHHGNMDRMWTLWQAIDPENRTVLLDEGDDEHDLGPALLLLSETKYGPVELRFFTLARGITNNQK